MVGAVDETIKGTFGQYGIWEHWVPVLGRAIRGEYNRAGPSALTDQLVDVLGLSEAELLESKVVELCAATHNSTNVEISVMWSK